METHDTIYHSERKTPEFSQHMVELSNDSLRIDILRNQLMSPYHEPEQRKDREDGPDESDKEGFILEKEINTSLTPIESISYRVLRIIGAGILGFCLIYLLFIFEPIISDTVSHYVDREEIKATSVGGGVVVAEDNKVLEEAKNYGVDSSFSIVIPKINAVSNVISNVDIGSESLYSKALEEGVAQAKGTYFPGQGKTIYLFSHSTNSSLNVARYNAVFYQLGLLQANDQVIIFFSNRKYVYKVERILIIEASDTSYLTKDFAEETLILQTCEPPGTTLKRLLVIANPVDK